MVKFCYDLLIFNGESFEMKFIWPNLNDYLAICLEGLRKIAKICIENNQWPGRDLKSLSSNSNQKRCSMNQLLRLSASKALSKSKIRRLSSNSTASHPKDLNPQEQRLYWRSNKIEKMALDSCGCVPCR
jgi:hypothetical protein